MIDAADRQMAPIDTALRAVGRRQPGARALQAHYGIGALLAVVILAELGDTRRFSSSRVRRSATPGSMSPCTSPTSAAARDVCHARVRRRFAGRSSKRPSVHDVRLAPTRLLRASRQAARLKPRLPRRRAQTAQTQLPHPPRARRGRTRSRITSERASSPPITDAPRPAPRILLSPHARGRPEKTERPQRFPPSGHPITIMCPTRRTAGRGPR